ncbi:glycosyltransferase [Bacillus infantis]|uniref:glycosyltransferase n=1 Tax=Bacillus infantis TaxID=324767 RepID=UPI001CD211D7|nr:glycosyltransferase [Bacillus infantis]MCA1039122.1 glycosyltransferase [Bacillus infantis]
MSAPTAFIQMIREAFKLAATGGFIVYAEAPVMNFYSDSREMQGEIFSFTVKFILFLESAQEKHGMKLAVTPIYYELLDQPDFQQKMAEYLKADKQADMALHIWEKHQGRLNIFVRQLAESGRLELLASPACSAILPFLSTHNGIRKQIDTGISIMNDYFSIHPEGFWFPKGAYEQGLDLYLAEAGILYSYINGRTIGYADPAPKGGRKREVLSPHGVIMVPVYPFRGTEDKDDGMPAVSLHDLNVYNLEKLSVLSASSSKESADKLERVHLSSSFLEAGGIPFEEISGFWEECFFLERKLGKIGESLKSSRELRIYKQMTREWMFFLNTAGAHPDYRGESEKHAEAFRKLERLFAAGEGGEAFLEELEGKSPILAAIGGGEQIAETGSLPKILMLSWEYPPNIVGGLSRHVHGLASSLAGKGFDVHVLTAGTDGAPMEEKADGVTVHRVRPLAAAEEDFLYWVGSLNLAMAEKGLELARIHRFSLIHAHDWLAGPASESLKSELGIPLLATIHATEHGRNNGIYTEIQKFIHQKESRLAEAADMLIVCSRYMREEIQKIFHIEGKPVHIIANGIHPGDFRQPDMDVLSQLPVDPHRRLVFSLGRMVKEKGFDTLLDAAALMKEEFPDVYYFIAGKGPLLDFYRRKTEEMGLSGTVFFIGFIGDEQRNALFSLCDIAVFPSEYEPFGIVALESMIHGKPTIVSDTGGLKGIVSHKRTGLLMEPGSALSFKEQAAFLLCNKQEAEVIGSMGKTAALQLFSWDRIAEETKRVMEDCVLGCRI